MHAAGQLSWTDSSLSGHLCNKSFNEKTLLASKALRFIASHLFYDFITVHCFFDVLMSQGNQAFLKISNLSAEMPVVSYDTHIDLSQSK